jgi:hypothetical protein
VVYVLFDMGVYMLTGLLAERINELLGKKRSGKTT